MSTAPWRLVIGVTNIPRGWSLRLVCGHFVLRPKGNRVDAQSGITLPPSKVKCELCAAGTPA